MRALEIARMVKETQTCHVARPRKDTPGQYDAKPYNVGSRRGWVYLDLTTAHAIVSVHDALNPTNQAKFSTLPLVKMARVAWKLVK